MALTKIGKEGITGIDNSSDATAITISSGEVVTLADDLIIKDSGTIGSASKTDAITIASSGLVQLTSTGIGAGSQVFQVIDDGATLFQIRSEDGNVSFPQSGAGIYLGVTSGNSANLLNDYEEGTWTPTLVSSGATFAYSVQQGIYTKIGDVVNFHCVVQLDGGGNSFTSNSVSLNGWPFTSRNSSGAHSRFFISGRYLNLDHGNDYTFAYADLNGNSSSAPLKEGGDNVPTQNLTSNDLSSSSGQLYLHGHYFTDS